MSTRMLPVMMECRENDEHPGSYLFIPVERYNKICKQQFTPGEQYPMMVVEPRDMKSHSHYFASINETWKNLAEEVAKNFPTSEHLRAYALIECGYCDSTTFECDSEAHAKGLALLARKMQPYCRIKIRGNVVEIRVPHSQRIAPPPIGMTNETFRKSKRDVLDLISALAHTDRQTVLNETAERFPPRDREPNNVDGQKGAANPTGEKSALKTPGGLPAASELPTSMGAVERLYELVKTADQYMVYCCGYIALLETQYQIQTRYDEERGWRAKLGVSVKSSMALQRRIDDRFARDPGDDHAP